MAICNSYVSLPEGNPFDPLALRWSQGASAAVGTQPCGIVILDGSYGGWASEILDDRW